MPTRDEKERLALVQGTLDLLILRILLFGPQHGQGVARAIQTNSEDVLLVDHGALYPALQRMLLKGWVTAEWGVTAGNRRARYYQLTTAGRKQLHTEMAQYERVSGAIQKILQRA